MTISGEGQIQGGGKDDVGTFNLKGHISGNGDVEFVKAYTGAHSVNYKGKLDDNGAIKGNWDLTGMTGGFEIHMKTKRWVGAHTAVGGQSLGAANKLVVSLDFDPKSIHVRGIGHDEKGSFAVQGVTPTEFDKKVITLEKRYFNNPKVRIFYAGVIVNQGGQEVVKGTWQLPGAEVGDFTITKQP